MSLKSDGHPTQVEALQGTVDYLTRQLIDRDLTEAKRKADEAEAAKPKPEPFELRYAKEFFEREFRDHSEHYRQWAWDEHTHYANVGPAPLAAGWPKGYDPVKFVRSKVGLNEEGTALLGAEPAPSGEPTKTGTFMDQWLPK